MYNQPFYPEVTNGRRNYNTLTTAAQCYDDASLGNLICLLPIISAPQAMNKHTFIRFKVENAAFHYLQ